MHLGHDLRIDIAGLEHGSRAIDHEVEPSGIKDLSAEFLRPILITGSVRRVNHRFYLDIRIATIADLVCDRSLEPYTESVDRQISAVYELNGELAQEQRGQDLADVDIRGLYPDAQWIDVSEDVRQELMLGLPMKRIAPQYREQSIEQIFPDLTAGEVEPDSRWEALEKLRGKQS